jgi:ribose transport system permease protein
MATSPSVATSPVIQDERIRHSSRFQRFLEQPALWIAVVDIGLILLFGLISPNHVFFNTSNFTNMALDSAEVVLLAVGMSFLLGAGELDISIGANIILASVVGAKTMVALSGTHAQVEIGDYPHLAKGLVVGITVTVLCGIAFGLVNAFIVTVLGVNSFIATLGTLGIGTGLAFVLANGNNIQNIPTEFQSGFGVRTVTNIPLPALVTAIAVLALWGLLALTRFGLHTLAIGSSRQAAQRAGIPITLHLVLLFALVGMLAGICAVYDIARFSTTNISGHQTEALSAIAGAVIGGTNLFGGRVSIPGAVFGALLAVILETGLVIQGLSPFYQLIVVGVVLIFAVYIRGVDIRRGVTQLSRRLPGGTAGGGNQ